MSLRERYSILSETSFGMQPAGTIPAHSPPALGVPKLVESWDNPVIAALAAISLSPRFPRSCLQGSAVPTGLCDPCGQHPIPLTALVQGLSAQL